MQICPNWSLYSLRLHANILHSYFCNTKSFRPVPKPEPESGRMGVIWVCQMELRILFLTDLFGELLLAQFVQGVELASEQDVALKTTASEFDTDDDLSVGNHHGDGTELNLQILW